MILPTGEIGELIVLAVAPFVKKLVSGLGEGELERAQVEAYATAKALYQQLRKKAQYDPSATAVIEQLVTAAENVSAQSVLIQQLTELLTRDPVLAQSLSEIVQSRSDSIRQNVLIGGDVSDSVVVVGNNNVVTLNTLLPEPKHVLTGESSNIPGGGSRTFVGRDDKLGELHQLLSSSETVAITAIYGMAGIGKTELARQYAIRYADSYPGGCCWLRARGLDVFTQLVAYAKVYLDLCPPDGLELSAQAAYCWSHWPLPGRVLVVIDDVTDYKRIATALPPESARFFVLMTTRHSALAVGIIPFELSALSQVSALLLFQQIVAEPRPKIKTEIAQQLCEWLGYLPLGIELVGHYLRRKPDIALATLQQRLKKQRLGAKALQQADDGMTAQLGVLKAFELSWETLPPNVQQLACRLSLFAVAPFPWQLVTSQAATSETEEIEDARDLLVDLSLLQRVECGVYQLHQLVREYFLAKLEQRSDADEQKRAYCQIMIEIGQQIPESPTRKLIVRLMPTMPHIAEAAISLTKWISDEVVVWPFIAVGRFYEGQGAYSEAEPYYVDCLSTVQNRFDEDNPYVALSINNLAMLYAAQGRYREAKPLYQKSLRMRQKLFGSEHPDVAFSLNNLASIYLNQGCYREAEPLIQQSLVIYQSLPGKEHPDIARSLSHLAKLHECQGRYSESEIFYQQALEMRQKLLGREHTDVAHILNDLAMFYYCRGHHSEAEPLFQQSLAMYQKLSGKEHPNIALSLNNLAALYERQDRYSEAEMLYQQALEMRQKLLGREHPDIALSLGNLGGLFLDQGRLKEAEPLCQQALEMTQKLLGKEHPDSIISLNNLAVLYDSQGRYSEAEPLYQQALAISQNLLGKEHPCTQRLRNNIKVSEATNMY